MKVEELAQKLYEDDGHSGNLYKADSELCRYYDNKAAELLDVFD